MRGRLIRGAATLLAALAVSLPGCAEQARQPGSEPTPSPRRQSREPAAGRRGPPPTPAPPAAPATPGIPAVLPGAGNASDPGEVEPEPATFHSLGVRWPVRGDANADATVTVRHRRVGESAWRPALPLFRTHPAHLSPDLRVAGGWLWAGSVLGLAPDTEYEVALRLEDPDGGGTERRLSMRTAAEPRLPEGMRVRHIVPGEGGGTGSEGDPFRGLPAAQAKAQPGDLFLLRAGQYRVGRWTVDRHGAPGRPIVYRAAGDGPVVLDGLGGERLVSAPGARHVWFEGLTFRNARYLLVGHAGSHLVVRRSRFHITRVGLEAINGGYRESRGFVITDNVFEGPSTWPRGRGIEPVHAVSVTGAGHVVAHNHIAGVGDGVHGSGHGRLAASDVYGNEIEVCTDDGIEADHADTNVRVFDNRITNCFAGVSAQPVRGGPLYVYRNAIYNTEYSPVKLHNHTAGVLIFHNTSVRRGIPFAIDPAGETVNDVVTRNNLFVGTRAPALASTGRMIRCDLDADGYAWPGGVFAQWNGRTYATVGQARRAGVLYRSHGAALLEPGRVFAAGPGPPADPRARAPLAAHDPRLREGTGAVDGGVPLPTVNDGFAGRAPDLGCCELGRPLPRYGPRPASGG